MYLITITMYKNIKVSVRMLAMEKKKKTEKRNTLKSHQETE